MAKSSFRSPLGKLVRFFEASRDRWKEKCKEAKRQLKLLKQRIAQIRASRDRWKEKARQLEAQLREAQTASKKPLAAARRSRQPARLR